MKPNLLKTTAFAALTLGVAPLAVSAQEADPELCSLEEIALPCVTTEGDVLERPRQFILYMSEQEDMPRGQVRQALRDYLEDEGRLAEMQQDGEGTPSADDVIDLEAGAEADGETSDQAQADAEAQAQADARAQAQADAEAQAEADRAAEEAAAEEARAAEEAAAEQARIAEEEQAAAEAEANATADAETTTVADGDLCNPASPMLPCVTEDGETLTEFRQARDYFRETLPRAEARTAILALREQLGMPDPSQQQSAAAAGEGGDADVEVSEEEVAQDDVRQSDEDFQTGANEQVETAEVEEDSGMSDFQKALLLGLGAVAVGSILDNGTEVVANTGDRVVIDDGAELRVLKNDDVLLRQVGSDVRTETFADGSTRTFYSRDDGIQIVTIRAADGTVLRRSRIDADGTETLLFDDTREVAPIQVSELPAAERTRAEAEVSNADADVIRAALMANLRADVDRSFSLRQIRTYKQVRALAPEVALDTVTFASGSAAIDQTGADALIELGLAMSDILEEDPSQIFLIEGHTDAVGAESYNLALSDRRAETVALALTEVFDIAPENLITQGYGETDLLIPTEVDERLNRRASVRNITDLLN